MKSSAVVSLVTMLLGFLLLAGSPAAVESPDEARVVKIAQDFCIAQRYIAGRTHFFAHA